MIRLRFAFCKNPKSLHIKDPWRNFEKHLQGGSFLSQDLVCSTGRRIPLPYKCREVCQSILLRQLVHHHRHLDQIHGFSNFATQAQLHILETLVDLVPKRLCVAEHLEDRHVQSWQARYNLNVECPQKVQQREDATGSGHALDIANRERLDGLIDVADHSIAWILHGKNYLGEDQRVRRRDETILKELFDQLCECLDCRVLFQAAFSAIPKEIKKVWTWLVTITNSKPDCGNSFST